MAKSVVGLFENVSEAEAVVRELEAAGFDRSGISILASEEARRHPAAEGTEGAGSDTAHGAMVGAGTGAAIGGGLGLVAGLASLAIPGFGAVIAAGPIASALAGAGIGAAAGGVIGALTHVGVPESDAEYYAEGVRRGGTLVTVRAEDEQANRAADIMEDHGAEDVEQRAAEWRSSGWHPTQTTAASWETAQGGYRADDVIGARNERDATRLPDERERTSRDRASVGGTDEIPVVEERVDVGKRAVTKGGARLYTHVAEVPVDQTVNLRDEEVHVGRRPVDRPATAADMATAFKEDTIELVETREEPVVSKTARVVEEVSFGKEVHERQQQVHETARKTEVDVQRMAGGAEDADYRRDFETRYAGRGHHYDRYASAYQYGSTIAGDARYRDGDWNAIEPQVRRDWEARGVGAWEEFKDAVRYGWEKVRGRR